MILSMSSDARIPRRAGNSSPTDQQHPGGRAYREELLSQLFEAQERVETLTAELAKRSTNSPTAALLLNMGLERFLRRLGHHQLVAAYAAQHSLAHELPVETLNVLREILEHPADFIASDVGLPSDPRTVPTGRLAHKDTAELLQHTCSIDFYAARDRLEAAQVLLTHSNADGISIPVSYPLLADHLRSGRLDPRETILATKRLEKLRPAIARQPNPDRVATAIEAQIVDSLLTQGPGATGKLFAVLGQELENKPAPAPSPQELAAKVGCRVVRRTEHLTQISICLLNTDAEVFMSLFAQADNPRTLAGNREAISTAATVGKNDGDEKVDPEAFTAQHPAPENCNLPEAPAIPEWAIDPATPLDERPRASWNDLGPSIESHRGHPEPQPLFPAQQSSEPSSSPPATSTRNSGHLEQGFPHESNDHLPGSDGLTPARRRLQVLLNILRSAGQPGTTGSRGLPQPRMIVYCQLTTLLGLAEKAGVTQHGLPISPGDLRRELCNAGVIPIIFNGESQILDVGREQRFVPAYMRQAILARDGGCLVPGCSVPPEHVEMCHVEGFAEGGPTSVVNIGAGCTAHHHAFHTGEFKLVLNEQGLPAVIQPRYMDPVQLPRRNSYWQQQHQINPTLF